MNPDGPYLSVAALCESVLEEKNGRITCVRFLDTIDISIVGTVAEITELQSQGVAFNVWCFVAFKSGRFQGEKFVEMRVVKPEGEPPTKETPQFPLKFVGDENGGVNLVLQLGVQTISGGLYWFEVWMDNELVTRIPLKVTIKRTESPLPSESAKKA